MALEQDASSSSENLYVTCRKEANSLSTLYGIANFAKNGTTKLYPPTDVSVSLQCRQQLLLVKFENLVHIIFRN